MASTVQISLVVIAYLITVNGRLITEGGSLPIKDIESTSKAPDDAIIENLVDEVKATWSPWSDWSACSRSCNGGITYQLRKCKTKTGCEGEDAKYRICNMQPCPVSEDFRASQCSAFNNVPYRGHYYEWLPYQDPEDPCSLTCLARDVSFVAKLAPYVKDGTRCREGSLDMCVKGKCLAVGCDLQLGSNKNIDECGVCGGDGSTCKRPVYVWSRTPYSPCSVSCGGGYRMSRPTCLNKATDKEVDERLCDVTQRPRPQIKECNTHQCPPIWVTDSWSPCSKFCGGGRQSRQVHCAQMGPDGIRIRVDMHLCVRQKPLTERPCNTVPCPQWITGPWSGCSVNCGKGHKTRSVACHDAKGHHSEDCDVEVMPPTKQECDSGLICSPSEDPGNYLFSDIFKGSLKDAPPAVSSYHALPWKQKQISTEPSYSPGDWSECSTTCGQGIRKRKVDCKIFLEFSRTVAILPDRECPGPRPPDVESCFSRPCSFDQNKPEDGPRPPKNQIGIEVTYSWRVSGYTPCSASCLGGVRDSIVQCVRDHDQSVVLTSHCDISKKPNIITQTCNDHPCPPKWNVSEYSTCSKQCGGGVQVRVVHCLHEVTRGAANTLVVSNDQCPEPQPRDKQFCNVFDCPTKWEAEPWSKCSKSCGGGKKTRKLRCLRELAFGQIVELAPSSCPKRQPKSLKSCNSKPCPDPEDALNQRIYPSHQTYVQEKPRRRVFLKVGGTAIVFAGTNLKIRCPSRKSNKTTIQWYKNDDKITSSRRIKISLKGALRIRKVTHKDSGKYTCESGFSKADLYISVKPAPPTDSEEQEEHIPEKPAKVKPNAPSTEEIFSHERRPTSNKANNEGKGRNNYKHHIDTNMVPITHDNNNNKFVKSHENRGGARDEDDGDDGDEENDLNKISHHSSGSNVLTKNTGKNKQNKFDISTLERIPLYVLAGQTTEGPRSSTELGGSDIDSNELVPSLGGDPSVRTKPDAGSSHEDQRNEIPTYPFPKTVDSWEQKYDGSRRKPQYPKPYDTWERNHGGALFSDQESGELNFGTPHGGKGFPGLDHEPASSGASSTHSGSRIQQLLVNLHHTLGGGGNTIAGGRTTAPAFDKSVEDMNDEEVDGDEVFLNPSKTVASSFILGKGNAENLHFEWVIGDWSTCSHSCGTTGFQVRATQCLVRLNNVTKTVDSSLCEDAGLKVPETVQNCGSQDCPRWISAPWSECLESQCFTWHTSYQKRTVYCRTSNGTNVPSSHCDEKTRPRRKRECYNENCRSTWKVGEWSDCTASCGRRGFQSRILQCVWFGSAKPAGNTCRDQPRPSVERPCTGPPCQSSERRLHRSIKSLQLSKGYAPLSPESIPSPML